MHRGFGAGSVTTWKKRQNRLDRAALHNSATAGVLPCPADTLSVHAGQTAETERQPAAAGLYTRLLCRCKIDVLWLMAQVLIIRPNAGGACRPNTWFKQVPPSQLKTRKGSVHCISLQRTDTSTWYLFYGPRELSLTGRHLVRTSDPASDRRHAFIVPLNSVPSQAAVVFCAMLGELANCALTQMQTNADGRTPLHLAALKGHSNVVKFLLSKQAWADAQDAEDNTALHLAARSVVKGCTPYNCL